MPGLDLDAFEVLLGRPRFLGAEGEVWDLDFKLSCCRRRIISRSSDSSTSIMSRSSLFDCVFGCLEVVLPSSLAPFIAPSLAIAPSPPFSFVTSIRSSIRSSMRLPKVPFGYDLFSFFLTIRYA